MGLKPVYLLPQGESLPCWNPGNIKGTGNAIWDVKTAGFTSPTSKDLHSLCKIEKRKIEAQVTGLLLLVWIHPYYRVSCGDWQNPGLPRSFAVGIVTLVVSITTLILTVEMRTLADKLFWLLSGHGKFRFPVINSTHINKMLTFWIYWCKIIFGLSHL